MEHPCAICASRQRTCCQRAEILLTRGDVARIVAATGEHGFVERRSPDDPEYIQPDADDPTWLGLTLRADGTRRMLKRLPDGDCHFLGPKGCRLTEGVRPLVCRLYPFAYTARGLDGVDQEYCPMPLFTDRGRDMVEVLGMDVKRAERWRKTLYAELEADHRADLDQAAGPVTRKAGSHARPHGKERPR